MQTYADQQKAILNTRHAQQMRALAQTSLAQHLAGLPSTAMGVAMRAAFDKAAALGKMEITQ